MSTFLCLQTSATVVSNSSQVNRSEDEREAQPPPNVVPFPTAHADDVVDPLLAEKTLLQTTKQVAAILKVPVSDSLQRVTADYLADPRISLLGEADAAREWIDDPRRNRKRQQLTPAFFRRWLKREQETTLRDHAVPPPEHRLRGQGHHLPMCRSR